MGGRDLDDHYAAASSDPLPRAGQRIVLRRFKPDDLTAFQAYRHDPEVGRYQGWEPCPDAEATAFLDQMASAPLFPAGDWIQLAITDRVTGDLIGDVGVRVAADGTAAVVGFSLRRASQSQGLGTAEVGEVIRLIFERTEVRQVVGVTDARNLASCRLLERVGGRRIATNAATFRGEACVEHTYAVEWHEALS